MKINSLGSTRAEHPTGTLLESLVPMTTNVPWKWNGQWEGLIIVNRSSCFSWKVSFPGNPKAVKSLSHFWELADLQVPKEMVPRLSSVLDEILSNPSGTCLSNGFSSRYWTAFRLTQVARFWLQQVQRCAGKHFCNTVFAFKSHA